ncbi:MAG: hypothetical protein AVDCRST_MAG73-1567, partial [uncultured Thermomicrobiales bacterium]
VARCVVPELDRTWADAGRRRARVRGIGRAASGLGQTHAIHHERIRPGRHRRSRLHPRHHPPLQGCRPGGGAGRLRNAGWAPVCDQLALSSLQDRERSCKVGARASPLSRHIPARPDAPFSGRRVGGPLRGSRAGGRRARCGGSGSARDRRLVHGGAPRRRRPYIIADRGDRPSSTAQEV